jgi:hypothetical protein
MGSMITVEAAQAAAEAYVSENRTTSRMSRLLEDSQDYLVETEMIPGSPTAVMVGPAAILISKATGIIREEAYGKVFDKMLKMKPVA